jgi:hypothetical protein
MELLRPKPSRRWREKSTAALPCDWGRDSETRMALLSHCIAFRTIHATKITGFYTCSFLMAEKGCWGVCFPSNPSIPPHPPPLQTLPFGCKEAGEEGNSPPLCRQKSALHLRGKDKG